MSPKLSFSVEDAKVISENPDSNFAILDLAFFASGVNLHNLYVSEETLMKTADSIKNCPLVWKYDERLDDIYTHDPDEVPCGFVPDSSSIKAKKLDDGRTMLSVMAYVWKRYTGQLLDIFKRDGGKKPVSVEMSVYETKPWKEGKDEITEFRYEGITILGSYVTPAIPLAGATILSFAKLKEDYNDALKEFSVDLKIPSDVKENAKKGLDLSKKYSKGTSVGITFARHLSNDGVISPEDARHIVKYFSEHNKFNLELTDIPTDEYISHLLYGGTASWKWAQSIIDKLDKDEKEKLDSYSKDGLIVTFPYKSIGDMNPALKGISPPITVAQGNEIARQADAIGSDKEKNGWAIAIANFKKTHTVKDGKWVKKEDNAMEQQLAINSSDKKDIPQVDNSKEVIYENKQDTYLSEDTLRKEEENMEKDELKKEEMTEEVMQADEKEKADNKEEEKKEEELSAEKKEEMAAEKKEEEKVEENCLTESLAAEKKEEAPEKKPTQDKIDGEDKEKKEDKPVSEKVGMSISVTKALDYFKQEAPKFKELNNSFGDKILETFEKFALEVANGEFDAGETFVSTIENCLKESYVTVSQMASEHTKAMAELESLRTYKKSTEEEKFAFEIDSVLAEAKDAGMPEEEINTFKEEAKTYSLEGIDEFKNKVKAKAFAFARSQKQDDKEEESFVRIALPFQEQKPKADPLWQ